MSQSISYTAFLGGRNPDRINHVQGPEIMLFREARELKVKKLLGYLLFLKVISWVVPRLSASEGYELRGVDCTLFYFILFYLLIMQHVLFIYA